MIDAQWPRVSGLLCGLHRVPRAVFSLTSPKGLAQHLAKQRSEVSETEKQGPPPGRFDGLDLRSMLQ